MKLPGLANIEEDATGDLGNKVELQQLSDALYRMGCAGLLDVPWKVPEENLIRDIIGPMPNTWDNTLTSQLVEWTPAVRRKRSTKYEKRGV